MKKLLWLLTAGLLVGGASASTIGYDFETADNISGSGSSLVYTDADSNDFGSGVTIGDFTLTDRDATQYSRFVNIGGDSVEAGVGSSSIDLVASFTITIDDTVTVDLSSIVFDTSCRWTGTGSVDDVFVDFYTTVGGVQGSTSNFDWTHDGAPNYQNVADNTVDLSSLTGLTDTSVTFTWELGTDRNNNFGIITQGLDDISLTGTVTAIPEPATIGMLGLGTVGLLAFRRRMRG